MIALGVRPVKRAALATGLSVTLGLMALGAAGCTPIAAYNGFQAVDQRPQDVKIGEDTRSTVLGKLGSPSSTSAFDSNQWFYITQITHRLAFYQPRVQDRLVVSISFDTKTEKVTKVETYGLKDGKVIAYNGKETPTRGRELTVLEQLLGTVGRGGLLPQDEERRPGDRQPN